MTDPSHVAEVDLQAVVLASIFAQIVHFCTTIAYEHNFCEGGEGSSTKQELKSKFGRILAECLESWMPYLYNGSSGKR